MNYEKLLALNKGTASNADLNDRRSLDFIHVPTTLDELTPELLRSGKDVVLTGNPGDGKSHVARRLDLLGRTNNAKFVPDLSAIPVHQLVGEWSEAAQSGRAVLLCANEGPLVEALPELGKASVLRGRVREVQAQLGHLLVTSEEELPPSPERAVLIDLADRGVCDSSIVQKAFRKVARDETLPQFEGAEECSAYRNIELLRSGVAPANLARAFALAGRACTDHISFRQLWSAISVSITGGRDKAQLQREARKRQSGDPIWDNPLDLLCDVGEKGELFRCFRAFADPVSVPWAEIDEPLWREGKVAGWPGELIDGNYPIPSALWNASDCDRAMKTFKSLKRLYALTHARAGAVWDALEQQANALGAIADADLKSELLLGLQRLFVAPSEESAAPGWLRTGVPIWVTLNYTFTARSLTQARCPFVAVAAVPDADLELRRPVRPPWLKDALGQAPDLVWLHHRPSGVALRVDGPLHGLLRRSATLEGPMDPPEVVLRFLARLSGWEEKQPHAEGGAVAFLEGPRKRLICADVRRTASGAFAYGVSDVG